MLYADAEMLMKVDIQVRVMEQWLVAKGVDGVNNMFCKKKNS